MIEQTSVIQYKQNGTWHNAKCDKCLYKVIGDYADIYWNIKEATMKICKSQYEHPSYQIVDGIQILKRVHYCHSDTCPFLNEQITKNPARDVKPCACVLIHNKQKNEILLTKRALNLSFPGAWVLPGGHLEKDQTIFEGGVRQCEEEVGLSKQIPINVIKEGKVMIWESVYTIEDKVKASGIIVFFMVESPEFEVKALEQEVIGYKWKNLHDSSDEVPYCREKMEGYAQGHRKYMKIIRQA